MDKDKPWVRLDIDDVNPSIRGNAKGLGQLRDKIDEAIESGHSLMGEFDCDFNQIEVSSDYPKAKKNGYGFRLMMIILGVIVILGVITLICLLAVVISEFSSR